MCAHSDARSKSKYLTYFLAQGVFRAPGTDVIAGVVTIESAVGVPLRRGFRYAGTDVRTFNSLS
jgi:hypothetical protein